MVEVPYERRIFLVLVVLITPASVSLSRTLRGRPYFEGKVIKIIVGHEVGEAMTVSQRLLARHSQSTSREPTFLVEDMPGAANHDRSHTLQYCKTERPDHRTLDRVFLGATLRWRGQV